MKTKELIAKLRGCPKEAEIYFDDGNDGLIDVNTVEIVSASKLQQRGRESRFPAVILSDLAEIG